MKQVRGLGRSLSKWRGWGGVGASEGAGEELEKVKGLGRSWRK